MIESMYNEMQAKLGPSEDGDGAKKDVGLTDALLEADYRKATWFGMFLALSINLSGINVVNVYALTIFENIQKQTGDTKSLTPAQNVNFIGISNLVGALLSVYTSKPF